LAEVKARAGAELGYAFPVKMDGVNLGFGRIANAAELARRKIRVHSKI
jgi:hypothetical protein